MELSERLLWLNALHAELHTVVRRGKEFDLAAETWMDTHRSIESAAPHDGLLKFLDPHFEAQAKLWDSVSGLLFAWARASMILFPNGGDEERGAVLRARLEVDETSFLRDRELRNDWVHFDERLDTAIAKDPASIAWEFVPRFSDESRAALQISVAERRLYFRTGRSERPDLGAMVEEAQSLRQRVLEKSRRIHEWHSDPVRFATEAPPE